MDKLEGITDPTARSFFNMENHLVFDPPAYIQRYKAVINCLNHPIFNDRIRKVVEFGCSEMKFFAYIKNAMRNRSLLVDQVDIDKANLITFMEYVRPILGDFVQKRPNPLHVNVWCGSVSDPNPNFTNADAVIATELIEHVNAGIFEEIPWNIFGLIKPKIAVVTTPNSEFNVLFNLEPGKPPFRHYDHKFEFNREQFKDYCENICTRYPNYHLQIEGIGPPPVDTKRDIGYCSQLALFVRKDFYESLSDNLHLEELEFKDIIPTEKYELLESLDFPFYKDDRTKSQKILDEVKFHISRHQSMDDYLNYEKNQHEIPLSNITKCCWEVTCDEKEIEAEIKSEYNVENGKIILPIVIETDTEEEYENNVEYVNTHVSEESDW